VQSRAHIELERVEAGVPGLELITYGGLPRNRLTLVAGTAGSGKTVFLSQFLATGIEAGEPGVFVSFEERPEAIRRNMRSRTGSPRARGRSSTPPPGRWTPSTPATTTT